MKKVLVVLLSILLIFVATGCNDDDKFTFNLNYTEYTLDVGEEILLSADKSDETYEWASADVSIATVSNGLVKAVAPGTTVISATAQDVTKTCEITVNGELEPAPYFYLDIASTKVFVNSKIQIRAYFILGEYDIEVTNAVNWSVDNSKATIDNKGVVTGVDEGLTTVTATYIDADGVTHNETCQIEVAVFRTIQYLEEKVTLANPVTVSGANNNKNVSYKPLIEALEGTSNNLLDLGSISVQYVSASESVATVDADGTIRAVGSGSTSITATFEDKSSSILVQVADTITSKADLDKLGYATKEGNDASLLAKDKYYILVNDIDYQGQEIVPIAISHAWQDDYAQWARESYFELNPNALSFYATIDGCGYAIKNAVLPSSIFVRTDLDLGIGSCFIGSNYGTLKNIAFYNLTTQLVEEAMHDINEEYFLELSDTVINSGLVVENYGTLQNIYLDIVVRSKNYLGARSGCLTAYALGGSVIENCVVIAETDYKFSKQYIYPNDCGDFGVVVGQSTNEPFVVTNSFAISSNMTKFITDNRYTGISLGDLLYSDAEVFVDENKHVLESLGGPWTFVEGDLNFGSIKLNLLNRYSISYKDSQCELYSSKTLSNVNNSINTSITPELLVLSRGQSVDASTLDIVYESYAPEVATVSADGTITAKSAGYAIIVAKYMNQTTCIDVYVRSVISSKADLDVLGFATKEDPSLLTAEKYYVLTQDIDYNDAELVPIAANPTFLDNLMKYGRTDYEDLNPYFIPFAATLDGKGHVIKNAYIPSTVMVSTDHQFTLGSAFIGKNQGTVKNIGFVNLRTQLVVNESSKFNTSISDVEFNQITDTVTYSGLVNTNQGTLENIYLDMMIYKKNYGYYGSGALVANSEGGIIKNCIVVANKDYSVQGYKEYTGPESDLTEFGVVIGSQSSTNTVIANVYAVSSTLTKYVSKNEGTTSFDQTIYQGLEQLVASKGEYIKRFGGPWSMVNNELRFGEYLVCSLQN